MSTIKDVAKLAEVSVGTVSKVISRDPTVKAALRERVLAAIETLGYRPNHSARALRTNRIDVIGLVVPDITNPFFAQLAKCIEAEAAMRNLTVMLANSHDDEATERRQLSTLLDRAPRGVIIVASSESGRLEYQTDIPIVSVDRRFQTYPLISTHHAEGSAQLAKHLIGLGHRRIAYIAGPQNTRVGRARKEGFATFFTRELAADPNASLRFYDGHYDYQSGEDIGREILAEDPAVRPTAIAAASDQIAIGVMRAARDLDISIPDQLSVTGFDDIDLAALIVPRLTTLKQPTAEIGAAAVSVLIAEDESAEDIKLRGEIVVRGSTGPVNALLTGKSQRV
ncbi:LacI family DNA-binding transcriptional regulator [Tritonibacter horizontis]|uniref:Catabolite control protein A n=1 Tax=Tritonibacter horizontis TaxID=1768241 RepID=A0A132C226_9RHOB|nr:LacI family DNA-binding transcriptional regulator [Tritonibacter horizontis]KUP94633.1 catabolite control protein A [Tritonibacter horizontis]